MYASSLLYALIGALTAGVAVYMLMRVRLASAHEETRSVELDLGEAKEQRAVMEERAKQVDALKVDLVSKEQRVADLAEELFVAREARSILETQMCEQRKAFEEQKSLLDEAQKKLADAFNALSSDALRKNNQAFLDLAKETMEGFNKEAKGDLEQRKQAIDNLVLPLKDQLEKVDEHIKDLEEKRTSAYATLTEQVKSLNDSQARLQGETSNLVKALRNPNQRGRWGEMQLKRVVEMAGMLAWCDFHEQQTTTADGNVIRPDLTVMMPNHKTIVVDAKTPLDAYLRAVEATDDASKAEEFRAHARQVREHIRQLSSKRYWDQFESTPELVVLFIPGEPVFGAALEHDPSLIEYGVENRVLIATPVTLIGLLRSVAYGWRQESLEENAQKISQLGKDLYSRISALAEHFSKLGRNLDKAVGSYNDAVGSLESRVLPQARRFKELQASSGEDIDVVVPIETAARTLHRPEIRRSETSVTLFEAVVNS